MRHDDREARASGPLREFARFETSRCGPVKPNDAHVSSLWQKNATCTAQPKETEQAQPGEGGASTSSNSHDGPGVDLSAALTDSWICVAPA